MQVVSCCNHCNHSASACCQHRLKLGHMMMSQDLAQIARLSFVFFCYKCFSVNTKYQIVQVRCHSGQFSFHLSHQGNRGSSLSMYRDRRSRYSSAIYLSYLVLHQTAWSALKGMSTSQGLGTQSSQDHDQAPTHNIQTAGAGWPLQCSFGWPFFKADNNIIYINRARN